MASVGIDAIFTPDGNRTRTGVLKEFLVVPSPSWPCVPRPQAKRLPSASSAYCVEFDVPTSATGPGKVTIAGLMSVPKLPFLPPKNDPHRTTTLAEEGCIAMDDRGNGGSSEQPPANATATAIAPRAARTGTDRRTTTSNDL